MDGPTFSWQTGISLRLMDVLPGEVRFAEPLQLFRNLADRTFEEIADNAGLNAPPCNRAAIAARVTVTTSAMQQVNEVRSGGSYNSTSDIRLHFGLGSDTVASRLQIRWPSGLTQQFTDVPGD